MTIMVSLRHPTKPGQVGPLPAVIEVDPSGKWPLTIVGKAFTRCGSTCGRC